MLIELIAAAALGPAEAAVADGPNPHAPAQLAHMAPLIGHWDMRDWSRNADGEWVEGPGADWTFWWALDGYAVQDLWVAPGRDVAVDDPAKRQVGTNVRRVDPETGAWEMAWLTRAAGPTLRFTAESDGDTIVMRSVEPHFTGAPTRVTFYDMTGDSFDWTLERAADGETFVEILRLKGTRADAAPVDE